MIRGKVHVKRMPEPHYHVCGGELSFVPLRPTEDGGILCFDKKTARTFVTYPQPLSSVLRGYAMEEKIPVTPPPAPVPHRFQGLKKLAQSRLAKVAIFIVNLARGRVELKWRF